MSAASVCRCCLLRPPDKNLKTEYSKLGKTEVYADMLKECYEIHLVYRASEEEHEGGICDACVERLRDAWDFKMQVLQCQRDLLAKTFEPQNNSLSLAQVKEEIMDPDDDNDIMFLDLKEELSDLDEAHDDDDDDDKNLAEILGFDGVDIKRKLKKEKREKKDLRLNKSERKANKLLSPLKLSLLGSLKKVASVRYVSDNKKHKSNIENILKYSNCTPFSNKTLTGISCAYCKETYQDIEDLRSHTTLNHKDGEIYDNKKMDKSNISIKMDITDLKCNVCGVTVDVISNLKKHLSKEHDVKFYPDVKDYILEFKLSANDILNCALCNSTFETFKMLLQHMNGHYRNYICDVCDMGFINKHRLKNHQRTHELGTFKCSFCDKIFSTRVRKVCHEKYTHNTNARYTTNCPQCDQSFTSYYQRNRHMFKEHNTAAATYKCNICDKSFILKSKLTSHIKKVHLMERNHICSECGQGFFIKQSLDEHMVKHNGERVFKCMVCHKAYARKKTLREHMRIHNNDRRFKCGVCGSAFVQKCSLKSHMLSNHGLTLSEYESARIQIVSP